MTKYNAVVEDTRALLSVVTIDRITPIKKADRIELAHIGGWQVVVKKGEFQEGGKGLYSEIDSLLPTDNPIFSFLKERKDSLKTFDNIEYSRVRTIKLRGEISQGILFPLPVAMKDLVVGTNLTNMYHVRKLEEAALSAEGFDSVLDKEANTGFDRLIKWIAGPPTESQLKPWPSALIKSSQPRVQNIHKRYMEAKAKEERFEVSVKLDGSSMTVFSLPDRMGVCQRNNEVSLKDIHFTTGHALRRFVAQNLLAIHNGFLGMYRTLKYLKGKVSDKSLTADAAAEEFLGKGYFYFSPFRKAIKATDNIYARTAIQQGLLKRIEEFNLTNNALLTVQGELVGPGLQGNYEGLDTVEFFVYTVYLNGSKVMQPNKAANLVTKLGFRYVPVLTECGLLPTTVKECIAGATGPKWFTKADFREGLVYKSQETDLTFKVISNEYLIQKESKDDVE